MLQSLSISNYALIDELEMRPSQGLNIITGETGAGKSIMLGAVGLLLGNRADTKVLLNTGKKCIVEGEFEVSQYDLKATFEQSDLDYEDQAIIRREVSPTGKSRAFVNDTPVNLEVLKSIGQKLIDVHSQHDTLQLGSLGFQLDIIDRFALNHQILSSFRVAFSEYTQAKNALEQLKEEEAAIRRESDYNIFLLEELQTAGFEDHEQSTLEEERDLLANAEEIKSSLFQAIEILHRSEYSAIGGLEQVVQQFRLLAKYSQRFQPLLERLESALIELEDIRREAEAIDGDTEHDPARINEVEDRLSLLYGLFQKHQVAGIGDLLNIQEKLESKVNTFQNLDELIQKSESELQASEAEAMEVAKKLSQSRQEASVELARSLEIMLHDLGMPGARFTIEWQPSDLNHHGVDHVNILFSANKGITPSPLRQVASGGEFSRLMFGIKYLLAEKTAMPTLIFDEIDTGVSGEIALKLGDLMRQMAKYHQVVSISHLPQIAAKAERHFFVFKALNDSSQKTVSRIRELQEGERVTEIAKMISGEQPTESAFQNAKELMGS